MVGGLMIVYTAGAVTMAENKAIGGYFYTAATNTSVERLVELCTSCMRLASKTSFQPCKVNFSDWQTIMHVRTAQYTYIYT